MELCEENSECFVRKLQENKRLMTSVSSRHGIILPWKCVFMLLPGVADRSGFVSDYSLQLAIVICLYASMEKHGFAMCGLSLGLHTSLW